MKKLSRSVIFVSVVLSAIVFSSFSYADCIPVCVTVRSDGSVETEGNSALSAEGLTRSFSDATQQTLKNIASELDKTLAKTLTVTGSLISNTLNEAGALFQELGKLASNVGKEINIGVGNISSELKVVYDNNVKTISDVGRGQSCLMTLCISEYRRSQKIVEAENRAKKELEEYKTQKINEAEAKSKVDLKNALTTRLNLKKNLAEAKDLRLKFLKERYPISISFRQALMSESDLRNDLKQIQETIQFNNDEIRQIILGFETLFSETIKSGTTNSRDLLIGLSEKLKEIAESQQVSMAEVIAESIRAMDDLFLPLMIEFMTIDINSYKTEIICLNNEVIQLKIEIESIEQELRNYE